MAMTKSDRNRVRVIEDNESSSEEEFSNIQMLTAETRSEVERIDESVNDPGFMETDIEVTLVSQVWSGKWDFIFSLIGCNVGLGAIWRFPYMVANNGGGAFIIPYLVMIFCIGIPISLLELALGQYTNSGVIACWKFVPIFQGLGISMMIFSTCIALYYNVILTWAYYYLFASFTSKLPWSHCSKWSSPSCTNKTAALDYLKFQSIQSGHGYTLRDIGAPRWDMSLLLLFTWIVTSFIIVNGIKSSSKAIYFAVIFPYIMLLIFFFNGIWREGSKNGILFLIKPDFQKLGSPQVWIDATSQVFFSSTISLGPLMTFASYNNFDHNIVRDTLIVSSINAFTGIFGGFVIFSYIGNLAFQLNSSVDNIVSEEFTLLFEIYPMAMTLFPVPPLWSILFFLTILMMGIDSETALVESLIDAFVCRWPILQSYSRIYLVAPICIFLFIFGLPLTSECGYLIVKVLDNHAVGWNLMMICFVECIVISHVYGAKRMACNIEEMLGTVSFCYWSIFKHWFIFVWSILAPILLLAISILSFVQFVKTDRERPPWIKVIQWILTVSTLAPVVVLVLRQKFRHEEIIPQNIEMHRKTYLLQWKTGKFSSDETKTEIISEKDDSLTTINSDYEVTPVSRK